MGFSSDTFCPLPWMSLSVETNGQARPCCVSKTLVENHGGAPWKISQDRFSDAMMSPTQERLRTALSQGKKPESCQECWDTEKMGGESYRQTSLKRTGILEPPQAVELHHLDLKLGNRCNLRCRTCGPAYSTGWYTDAQKMGSPSFYQGNSQYTITQGEKGVQLSSQDFDWPDDWNFWSHLLDLVQGSKKSIAINFQGGEPLLNRHHLPFLRDCVARGIQDKIQLSYVTNLTVLPEELLDLWEKFENLNIVVSIDGIYGVNDYLRFPSRFTIVEANIDRLAIRRLRFCIQPSLSWMNVYYTPDLIRWALKKSHAAGSPYSLYFHMVYHPKYLQPRILPRQVRQATVERLRDFCEELNGMIPAQKPWWLNYDGERYLNWLQALELELEHSDDTQEIFQTGLAFTQKLDSVRGQTLEKSLPRLWGMIQERNPHSALDQLTRSPDLPGIGNTK